MNIQNIIIKHKMELVKILENNEVYKGFEFGGIYEANAIMSSDKIRFIYIQPSTNSENWIVTIPITKNNKVKLTTDVLSIVPLNSYEFKLVSKYNLISRDLCNYDIAIEGKLRATISK